MLQSTKTQLYNWFQEPHPNLPNILRWPVDLIRILTADWQKLDDKRVRHWFKTLVVGILFMFVLLVALVFTARWLDQSGRLAFEDDWLRALLAWSDFTIWQAIWMNTFGHTYVYLLVLLIGSVLLILDHKPLLAVTFGGAYFGSGFFVTIGWRIWNRARPEMVLDGLIPDLHSFPSGHTAQAVVVFGMLAYVWAFYARHSTEKIAAWMVAIILIGLVVFGRLLLGAHWPSDIVGGLILGIAWLSVLLYALK